MEMAIGIFKQLGADQTLLHQFIIVVVMFVLTKFLFLNHLQNIIETREDKTVNLEGSADKQFLEIDKIQNEYKDKIQTATKSVKAKISEEKAEIAKAEEAKYRTHEQEINTYIETSRKEVETEIKEKKDQVLNDAEQLASNLVQKLTKGL